MAKNRELVKPVEPESESGEEATEVSTESESESEQKQSKPQMKNSTGAKEVASPEKSTVGKRPAGDSTGSDNKRAKNKVDPEPVSSAIKPAATSNGDEEQVMVEKEETGVNEEESEDSESDDSDDSESDDSESSESEDSDNSEIANEVDRGVGLFVPNVLRSDVMANILRIGKRLFGGGKGIEGEKEWKRLEVEEIELYLKTLELRSAQGKLVLEALKKSH